ncbi:Unknown protein, partial [Striga hermonthica]
PSPRRHQTSTNSKPRLHNITPLQSFSCHSVRRLHPASRNRCLAVKSTTRSCPEWPRRAAKSSRAAASSTAAPQYLPTPRNPSP